MSFADRLKEMRRELGKNQKEMAEALGLGYRTLQSYEGGKNLPGGSILLEISVLGYDLNWLITGKGSKCEANQETKKDFAARLVELQKDFPEFKITAEPRLDRESQFDTGIDI